MEDYLLHHNANTHWPYPTSAETDALIASARETLADFLGPRPAEIAFGANMTTLTFHLARAIGRGWGDRDAVVVTELDHHANVAPWQALARDRGVRCSQRPLVPNTGQLDWDELEKRSRADHGCWQSAVRRTRWGPSTKSAGQPRWRMRPGR